MDKPKFLSAFQIEDNTLLYNLYEKLTLAEKIGRDTFTNEFYPPIVWSKLIDLQGLFSVKVFTNGIFPEAERKLIAFSSDTIDEYPIELLKVSVKSDFNKLSHGDYLGALMALGIKREKFGDLIIDEKSCYFPVVNIISEFVLSNLISIGKSPCTVEKVDSEVPLPSFKFEEMLVLSSSLRLDCIISALCGLSRNDSLALISRGKVLLNYLEAKEKALNLPYPSILSIRGYGKFKILSQAGLTAKGRYKINVQKFI